MLLKWHESFTVGHKDLDNEHRRLFDLISEIRAAETGNGRDKVVDLLNTLHLAAIEHFRHENSVMCEIIAGAYVGQVSHPRLSEAIVNEHRAEHARTLIDLENMFRLRASDQELRLFPRLMSWFVEHATDQDSHLREYFQSS